MLKTSLLGASFFIIAIHASLYNIESILGSEDEPFELQMEQVWREHILFRILILLYIISIIELDYSLLTALYFWQIYFCFQV